MSAYCQTSSATIKPSYCSTPPDPTSPYLRITQFPTHPPPRKMSFSLVQAVSAQPALSSRARPSTRTRSARAPTTPFLRGAVLRPVRAIPTDDEDDVMNAGWSATWTLQSYEDLAAQINTQAFELKDDIAETALGDVMSSPPITTTTDTPVSELAETFRTVSGLPVVNVDGKLIGVVSKKDVAKNETGTVGEVMSKPPIAAKPGYKVSGAAAARFVALRIYWPSVHAELDCALLCELRWRCHHAQIRGASPAHCGHGEAGHWHCDAHRHRQGPVQRQRGRRRLNTPIACMLSTCT
mmetsp:Transcript_20360/g.51264  ORF Transcript_20360/g.51264 Transcript_20360/m.51264 type:complete len:295 (+) Transcript_20360:48-932(+)